MIGKMDRYVGRIFLTSWFVSLVFFIGLFGIVDFFGNIDDFFDNIKEGESSLGIIGRFYLYQAPSIFLNVAPFIMLMSTLFSIMRLQRHNEFMAMQMTGRSSRRVLAPIFVLIMPFMGVMVWVQESVAPSFSIQREKLEARLLHDKTDWTIAAIDMKDASDRQFSARGYHVEAGVIERLYVSGRDAHGRNISIEGSDAIFDEAAGGWRLRDGRSEIRALGTDEDPIIEPAAFIQTDIRPEDLLSEYREPFDLSYSEVLERSKRYPRAPGYRLLRHYHVTYPLSVLLLVILGVPFVLKQRPRNNMMGVGISILLCLGFLVITATVHDLGNRGFVSPVLAAWLPVILAGSLGVVLLDAADT
jgi:lipopolysaccharide export system permease protein